MGLNTKRLYRAQIGELHEDPELGIRVKQPGFARDAELVPILNNEPSWLVYSGKTKVKGQGIKKFDAHAQWIITRSRLVMMAYPGLGSIGLRKGEGTDRRRDEHVLLSVARDELSAPVPLRKKLGGSFRWLRLTAVNNSFTIEIGLVERRFDALLNALSPDAEPLDEAAAERIREAKRQRAAAEAQAKAEAERLAAEAKAQEAHEQAARFETDQSAPARNPLASLRLLDHRRTWRFRVAAPPAACVQAFNDGFSKQNIVLRGRWDIDRGPDEATATYKGRGGVMAAVTMLSKTATVEQDGAIGSEVRFTTEQTDDQHTICAMWLASSATKFGFTADARFIKPYMRAVETELRKLDPTAATIRD